MEDKELILKIKNCKSVEELKALGKDNDYPLTDEEAESYFAMISKGGELSDDELSDVSGGACYKWRKGKAYSKNPPHIVMKMNTCKLYDYDPDGSGFKGTCPKCTHVTGKPGIRVHLECSIRTYYQDPLNP